MKVAVFVGLQKQFPTSVEELFELLKDTSAYKPLRLKAVAFDSTYIHHRWSLNRPCADDGACLFYGSEEDWQLLRDWIERYSPLEFVPQPQCGEWATASEEAWKLWEYGM